MTPKEKAQELVNQYDETLTYLESKSKAKECALIMVHEMIRMVGRYTNYWVEVKEEIYKL